MIASALRALAMAVLILISVPAAAQSQTAPAQTIWRLLDYIAVDYAAAVADGRIVNQAEYEEMVVFSTNAYQRLGQLPPTGAKGTLLADAKSLQAQIASKAPPETVATTARRLGQALLAAYPVPLAPEFPPNLQRAAQLYAQNCASCHGATGNGRGPDAAKLDPPPIDFTDRARARERSLFGLYQVIEQGLEGTAMESFAHLPPADRWSLAFFVGRFAYPQELVARGQKVWTSHSNLRSLVPNLTALVGQTPAQLEKALGSEDARAVVAFLRTHPEALEADAASTLSLAKDRLDQSLAAYERGDRAGAVDLALSAYLDGFEPVEPVLAARDGELMREIEGAMAELRSLMGRGAPVEDARAQIDRLKDLFTQAEVQLSPDQASSTSSFVGAFTVLLREGLEALLIVVAVIAFLRKADRQDVMNYVHGGWVAALVAGFATWAAATYLIGISGASRELTEGFGALFAAAVLISVGIWMHGKAQAGAWQRYISERLSTALSKKSAWFLFGLTFVVVYREVFETILFYATLWSQGNGGAVAAGAAAASALLAVLAILMLKYSKKLPVGQFFTYSSALIAILAVVLAGKGVAALQEAGLIGVRPLRDFPRIDFLGIMPTVQSLLAQAVVLATIVFGFWYNRRTAGQTARSEG